MRTAGLAPCGQFRSDPPGPIPPLMLPEDLLHQRPQPGIFLFAESKTALGMGVVTSTTDSQGLAHDSHGEAILFQMRDYGIDLFQVPWLKMAKAFFRMSRSRSVR